MLIRWIRARIHEIRSNMFILKYSNMITNVARDRTFEKAAGEAVSTYMNEMYILLPLRYKNILRRIRDEELLSEADYLEYLEASTGTVLGSSESYVFKVDTVTGEKKRQIIPGKAFPWKDDPSLLDRISEETVAKISELEADIIANKRDHTGLMSTLNMLPTSKDKPDTD